MKKVILFSAMMIALALASCSQEELFDFFHPKNPADPEPTVVGGMYAMTNDPHDNQIITYHRLSDGTIVGTGPVATGGKGTNLNEPGAPTFNDPRGTQDPLIMGYGNKYVFAVNAGSNDVTSFKVTADYGLMKADVASSGGVAPVSLANYKKWLYVVNAREGGSIQGYYVDSYGKLKPIDGSNVHLDNAVAGNIEFSPDGKYLVVSEKNTNNLTIFPIDKDGKPGETYVQKSNGTTPFGASFTADGAFLVTEAFGGAPGQGAVTSYKFNKDGKLEVISGSVGTHQTASCWVELNDTDTYAYTANTPDGTISSFRVGPDGSLELLESIDGVTEAGAFVLDTEIADDYLYQIANTTEEIVIFKIGEDGRLTFLEAVNNPMYDAGEFTGIAGF